MDNREKELLNLNLPLTEVANASTKIRTLFEQTLAEVAPSLVLYSLNCGENASRIEEYAHSVLGELAQSVKTANADNYIEVADLLRMVLTLKWVRIFILASVMANTSSPLFKTATNMFTQGVGEADFSEWNKLSNTSLIPSDVRETMNYGFELARSCIDEIKYADLDL